MAKFISFDKSNGEHILVNVDIVRRVEPASGGNAMLVFDATDVVKVKGPASEVALAIAQAAAAARP